MYVEVDWGGVGGGGGEGGNSYMKGTGWKSLSLPPPPLPPKVGVGDWMGLCLMAQKKPFGPTHVNS